MKKLSRKFFANPTLTVARELLGCELHFNDCSGIITETEAYIEGDPATHSTRGKTRRNAIMFEQGGKVYVYFTYGMHFCLNFVCGAANTGNAVLIRSIIPSRGVEQMRARRAKGSRFKKTPRQNDVSEKNLTNGPSKLCEAFGIDLRQNGLDLCAQDSEMFVVKRKSEPRFKRTPRIGIRVGQEKLWRFVTI